jgi:hypothetical protein
MSLPVAVNGLRLAGAIPIMAGGLISTLGGKAIPPLICCARAVPEPMTCR